jgi:alpha-tubulin suppressor-like RCC1 family protein
MVFARGISAGTGYTCAVTAAGTGYCWGTDASGQLGNGAIGSTTSPGEVSGGPVWREITAGRLHTCGIRTGGAAYCWGRNTEGQLGAGTAGGMFESPVAVSGDLAFAAIRPSGGTAGQLRDNGSLGQRTFTCGIEAGTGAVYCWGANSVYQVGDGTTVDRPAPVMLRQP